MRMVLDGRFVNKSHDYKRRMCGVMLLKFHGSFLKSLLLRLLMFVLIFYCYDSCGRDMSKLVKNTINGTEMCTERVRTS